jgi:hypothetical protein
LLAAGISDPRRIFDLRDQIANLCGVDVLQKRDGLTASQRPHVCHPHLARLTRLLVVPCVFAERYDRVSISNQSINDDSPVVAELTESHEYVLDDSQRANVSACQGEAIRLGPGYVESP